MDIEKVREKYLELKNSNAPNDKNNGSFIKRPIPYLFGSISFMAYHNVAGSNKLDSFIENIQTACWNHDPQLRRVFAIVQAYGCGKTKLGLMLTKEYTVLPWHSTALAALNAWLRKEEKNILRKINKPTLEDAEIFFLMKTTFLIDFILH